MEIDYDSPFFADESFNEMRKKRKRLIQRSSDSEEDHLAITREEAEGRYFDSDDESPQMNAETLSDEEGEDPKRRRVIEVQIDNDSNQTSEERLESILKELEPMISRLDLQSEVSPEILTRQLELMMQFWTPKNPRDFNEMHLIVMKALGIKSTDDVDPSTMENLIDKYALVPLYTIKAHFHISELLNNSKNEKSKEYESEFQKLTMLITYACESYYNCVLWANRQRNPVLDKNDSSVGILRYMPGVDAESLNEFSKMLIYCLLKLQIRRYRRYQGFIYKPIYNKLGYYTGAWERHSTIDEFVWSSIDVDRQFHLFKTMYAKGNAIPNQLIATLKHIHTSYFPELMPERYLSSWENGIYNVAEDKFYPYDGGNPYTHGLTKQTSGDDDRMEEGIAELERIKEKLPKYGAIFDAIINQIKGIDPNKEQTPCFISNAYCSSIYIPQVFIDQSGVPWNEISTPAFQNILNSQGFSTEVCKWFYAMMGRGLYWCGDSNGENWQICVMLLGASGTGKSTALKYLRQFFRIENVGILSNNIERQWALSSLIDKHIVIGYEIKGDFKWDQAEFQQCAACEEVLVFRKHKEAFQELFKPPMFMAANEMIKCWKDNSGALKRRFVIFPFSRHIPANEIKPNMMEDMMREFSLWIQKVNKCYRAATTEHGKSDIWSVLPKFLVDANETTMQTVHSLKHFFAEPNIIFGSDLYVSEAEFKFEFKSFCERNGYAYNKIRWTPDFYQSVFDSKGVKSEKGSMEVNGSMKLGTWIKGLAFINANPNQNIVTPDQI